MTSHLFRCRGAAAIVVVACCSLVLGNAFGQDEDGHVFGDSNLDGFFSNVDGQQDNGIDAPECSLNDSGDVTFGGDEPCFMSVEGAAALGSDYASLDGLYGAISCHDGRPLYSNIAGDGTVRMLWFSKAKQSWVLDAKLHGEIEPMSSEFLPTQVPSQNWLKKKATSAGAFYSKASGSLYEHVNLEVSCSTKRQAHIEKMRRQWIQHQDDKTDGQVKWEDLQTDRNDYAEYEEDDGNSRMTVSHGTEHKETAWTSWEEKEEKEVVKQIDHGVELVGVFILMVIVIGLTSSGLILILRQKEFQRRMYGHTNSHTWNHNIDWEQCQGAF